LWLDDDDVNSAEGNDDVKDDNDDYGNDEEKANDKEDVDYNEYEYGWNDDVRT